MGGQDSVSKREQDKVVSGGIFSSTLRATVSSLAEVVVYRGPQRV